MKGIVLIESIICYLLKQSQDASNEIYYDYDVLFYSGQLVRVRRSRNQKVG